MSRPLRVSLLQMVRRWLLPLGCYYVITLAVPFANGAARQGAIFASHALVVLVFPLLLIVLVYACSTSAAVCRRTIPPTLRRDWQRDPANAALGEVNSAADDRGLSSRGR